MTKASNIWMICWKLNGFLYDPSHVLQLSQFVWTACYSICDIFINFLLIDATDRIKISSDQKRLFIALSLYPLSLFANTSFNILWSRLNPMKLTKLLKIKNLLQTVRLWPLTGNKDCLTPSIRIKSKKLNLNRKWKAKI